VDLVSEGLSDPRRLSIAGAFSEVVSELSEFDLLRPGFRQLFAVI